MGDPPGLQEEDDLRVVIDYLVSTGQVSSIGLRLVQVGFQVHNGGLIMIIMIMIDLIIVMATIIMTIRTIVALIFLGFLMEKSLG